MSNIFSPLVRADGRLPINVDTGPIVGGTDYMHMRLTDIGEIECSNNAINHYGDALPFDVDGRMVVSSAEVAYWDQDIPFTASGAVAVLEDDIDFFDQGVSFTLSGHIATGSGTVPDQPPIWSEIPDNMHFLYELPQDYDVSVYVSSPTLPITGFAINPPVAGFSISAAGVVTAAIGAAASAHVINVEATNAEGTTAEDFTWTLITGNVPTWEPIPEQSHRENELPRSLDVGPYASSDSGPILSYSLVAAPAGFSIAGSVITVSAGTAVASYAVQVRSTNGVGAGDTSFTWNILEQLVPPVWSTIPNQSHQQDELPQNLDAALYVTTNAGPLVGWRLITPPVGFTISAAGVITVAAGTVVAAHAIVVAVSNNEGETSTSFTWTVSDTLLPPDWDVIPPRTVSEENLPDLYAVHPYVTSNSGPLTGWTLVSPPSGFSIDGAGVVTADATVAPGVYAITVRVSNDTGTSDSLPFDYEITLFFVVPQWSTIPDQSHQQGDLPQNLDVTPYVTTNSGPLINWSLVTPPTGFTISAAGVITAASGTAVAAHQLTVRVENDEGPSDSDPFTWNITVTLLPPQWSTVPAQSTREDNLPAVLDLTAYVTSNDGPLVGWALVAPPAGFTISASGLVTAAAGITPAVYPITARVSNNSGTTDSGAFNWTIESFYTVPVWSTIPDQATEEQLLPVVLDVKPYVTSNHGPLSGWSLVSPPSGWTIDTDGNITVSAARPVGSYSVTVRVSNDSGSADSAAFNWDILEEPEPPAWQTIPGRFDRENTLPQNYSVSSYATSNSNSGPLTGWQLVAPPTGFTISGAGVITAAAGTAVAIHPLTVRVSNDVGTTDSAAFTWEIGEELLPPQWQTVPDRQDRENVLPQNYDMSFYVTSNAGALVLWRLASAPAGFTIDSSGVVTAADTLAVGAYTLQVGVTNSEGESLSNFFEWEILEELLPPQWQTIPNRDDDEDTLPQTYDVSIYVSSNSGPLDTWSLVSPPSGFTINQSGVITAATGTAPAAHSITVRVFNDEGGADQSFIWTINEVATDEYFHEFNASLGAFTFVRAGAAYGYDTSNVDRTMATDQPVFEGCGWSGSDWTPDAGFLGIRFDRKSTNRVTRSNALTTSPWAISGASRTANSFLPGNAGGCVLYHNSQTSGAESKVISAWVREISAPNGTIYLTQNAGTNAAPISPVAGSMTQAKQNTGLVASGPGIAATASTGEIYCQYFQDETGGDPTGPILTTGSAASRSPMQIATNSSSLGWGGNDLHDGFCFQLKFRCGIANNDQNNFVPGNFGVFYALVGLSGGSLLTTDYLMCSYGATTGAYVRLEIQRGGTRVSDVLVTGVVFQRGGDYDIRGRIDPSNGLRLWVTGPGVNVDSSNTSTWTPWSNSNDIDTHRLGSIYSINQANNDGEAGQTYKLVRLNRTVLSDSAIEAWP